MINPYRPSKKAPQSGSYETLQEDSFTCNARLFLKFAILFWFLFTLSYHYVISSDGPAGLLLESPSTHHSSMSPPNLNVWPRLPIKSSLLRDAPRILQVEFSVKGQLSATPLPLDLNMVYDINEFQPALGPRIGPHWNEPNALDHTQGMNLEQCKPMHDWQVGSPQNCNAFHELDMRKRKLINSGQSRSAFEFEADHDGIVNKYVFKTSLFQWATYSEYNLNQQRRDAIALERTTSSHFISDIHGYCALGMIMDFMPEGNLHDYIKGARRMSGGSLSPIDKLRVAIHITTAVADLHTIDRTKQPSFAHNDICCHQFLFQNGVFKLNDFEYGGPIFVDKNTGESCTWSWIGMQWWRGRSLEEHLVQVNSSIVEEYRPDKIDVWTMGVVIYYVLTELYLYEKPEHLGAIEAAERMVDGERSPLPDHIANSSDPSFLAIMKALDMCWVYDVKERPSARTISDFLWDQLKNITNEKNPDVRVVLPERSKDQRPTDSEFSFYNPNYKE